jgi:SulP family sulfate permease
MEQNADQRKTEKLKPKLFSVMKTYSGKQFVQDLIAGVIVAIIALPLSIALALASGVNPEQGLYTAIVAGFLVSLLGGSRVQIAGPTAAFATIVAGIVATDGMDGLILSTVMAGILMIIMGVCKFGGLIKYIPGTITAGFTFGIAVTIVIGQIKDFCGLTFQNAPIETVDKLAEIVRCIGTFHWQAFAIGLLSLAILILWPKKLDKIPASLIAVIVCSLIVKLADFPVNTIGDLYTISNAPPKFVLPAVTFTRVRAILRCLGRYDRLEAPFQYGTGRAGCSEYRFGAVRRYSGDRCDRTNCGKCQKRRQNPDRRHGAFLCRADYSCRSDAVCIADPDADDRCDFVYRCI